MTSRERIIKTLKHKGRADRVPWTFNFGATQGFNPTLLRNYKTSRQIHGPICEHFDYDIFMVLDPDRFSPLDIETKQEKVGLEAIVGGVKLIANGIDKNEYFDAASLPPGGYLDAWGIYHVPWPTDPTFEIYHPPLQNIRDLARIRAFPSPVLDNDSLARAKEDVELIRSLDKISTCYSGSVYEWSWNIRGQERFFLDLYDQPEAIREIVEKISTFVLDLALSLQEAGVDMLAFYDDFGQQDRLQISREAWRTFIKPAWRKVWSKVKQQNPDTIIFLHSCGHITEVIEDLIEIGVDVIHPIQPEAMNVYEIADRYRDDVALWGTISCQKTLPLGSPTDVEKEIKERIDKIGSRGGLVISPANIMGPDVPLDNIDAFQKACRSYC